MALIVGGDRAAVELYDALADAGGDPTLIVPEPPVRDVVDAVRAKAVRTAMMEHRVCGLLSHTDEEGVTAHPGAVVCAGRRPTRLWTGEGGLGHGLALGLLSGADADGLGDVDDGPRGGLSTDEAGRTSIAGLYAAGGACGPKAPDVEAVADAVADERTPSRIPARDRDPVDHPMPDGFSEPKLERLQEILGQVDAATDDGTLAEAEREVRGLFGEMRSYLQARRSEELLDLRDAVTVAMGVVQALRRR